MDTFFDISTQFSIEKIFEMCINSHSETINMIDLLQYSYLEPKYRMISPYDIKIPAQDDKKIITSEKETHNYILKEEHPVNIYTAQEQNICAFYDDYNYVITHDVFVGNPEADKTQFTMNEYFYNNN